MERKRSIGLAILFGATLAVALFVAIGGREVAPGPGPLVVRSLPAYITSTTESLVFVKGFQVWRQTTPQPIPTAHPAYAADAYFPLGIECKQPLSTLWATEPTGCSGDTCSTSNIDWSDYDECVALAATRSVVIEPGTVISQPFALILPGSWTQGPVGGSGTSGDPYNDEYVPAWLDSDFVYQFTYTGGTIYYNGFRYDSDTAADRLVQMIDEAGDKWADNEQLAYVRIGTGESEEWLNVKCNTSHVGCSQAVLQPLHEATVTCAEYRAFVARLTDAALAAFPNTVVVVGASPNMCGDSNYNKGYESRYKFMTVADGTNPAYWAGTPTPIGISLNNIEPDTVDADEYGAGVPAGWGQFVVADRANEYGAPVVAEYRFLAGSADGDDWQYNYWTALTAAELGLDYVIRVNGWEAYDSWDYWDVIWQRVGQQDDVAWITFRDAEEPGWTWSSGAYGTTGQRDDYADHLVVLTPAAYPQYCSSFIISEASTRIAPIALTPATNFSNIPCGIPRTPGPTPFKLPTPKATIQPTPSPDATSQFNMLQRLRDRQARRMDIGASMGIAVDTDWTHYGDTLGLSLTLDYLDIGTSALKIYTWRGSSLAWDTETIARGNTGLWQRHTWQVTDAVIENGIPIPDIGESFIGIYGGDTEPTYVGDLAFAVTDSSTPTPTPTPTGTLTPSATPTATTTATPTATPTAAFTPQACPSVAVTVDGTLTEWGAVTPVVVSGTPGAYSYSNDMDGTPSAVSGAFYCAHDGDHLFIAGEITDGTVRTAPYGLEAGDAVTVAIDGYADGMQAPGYDDHSLTVGTTGRVYDYMIYSADVTASAAIASPGWRFELRVPAALVQDKDDLLTIGQQIGLTYTIINRDTAWASGVTYDDIRVSHKYSVRLE